MFDPGLKVKNLVSIGREVIEKEWNHYKSFDSFSITSLE